MRAYHRLQNRAMIKRVSRSFTTIVPEESLGQLLLWTCLGVGIAESTDWVPF